MHSESAAARACHSWRCDRMCSSCCRSGRMACFVIMASIVAHNASRLLCTVPCAHTASMDTHTSASHNLLQKQTRTTLTTSNAATCSLIKQALLRLVTRKDMCYRVVLPVARSDVMCVVVTGSKQREQHCTVAILYYPSKVLLFFTRPSAHFGVRVLSVL